MSDNPIVHLEVTTKTAQVIMRATELMARINGGQFTALLENIENEQLIGNERDEILELLQNAAQLANITAVSGKQASEQGNISWDVYQSVRQALAFQKNPERNPALNLHDDPTHFSNEPLPKIRVSK